MFVAGLGTAATPIPGPSLQAGTALSPPPPPAVGGEPNGAVAPEAVASPESPPLVVEDPFAPLLQALRKTLVPKKAFHIWDNSRGANNDFHIVLVEKNVRFPPLKARPPSTPQQPAPPLHSPISPLSPSSPLYPDGIMAPIWIRKHREMVPSVFILVLRLGEYASPDGPLDLGTKEDAERLWDAELVSEVVDRKRSTVERGIKLAVVLVCSRKLLDDPALDARLSLIRRQSGLDSRASLFVISPVPQSEVTNFVLSFRAELFPAALDYYREHGRRVRRKRARQVPKGKLSDKGWNVRYDYKMAIFSEMRGEMEVSLKHYEDSYDTLVDMFSGTSYFVPRTKRWAEAKVLADCLTVKICKVYLYLNEPSRCVAHLNGHVTRFRDLSNTWGIGEDTFEFWSWLSKQYRLFADLVAIAIRAGFRLPSLRPPPAPRPVPANVPQPPSPGLVPPNILFHPGYYFYLSGTCAVQRRVRFKALSVPEPEEGTQISPAIAHEMKVDHAELIIDLFTKAYEFFKAHKTSRMSLFVASQIALTHYEAGKYELALKFIERIARTYRREQWRDILDSLGQVSYHSAMKVGDYETAIRSLFSLLVADSRISLEQRTTLAVDLLQVLRVRFSPDFSAFYGSANVLQMSKTKSPSETEKATIVVDMTESAPFLQCHLAFWRPSCNIGHPVPFQLTLTSPSGSRSSDLHFSQLAIQFNDGRPPLVVSHGESEAALADRVVVQHLGDIGDASRKPVEQTASLIWLNDSLHVFTGTVSAAVEISLTISSVTLTLTEGDWKVNVVMRPLASPAPMWRLASPPRAIHLLHDNPAVCSIRPRDLNIKVDIQHESPAYLDEEFVIGIDVMNHDEVEIEVFLDILLQPGDDDSKNQLLVDDQTSFSLIKALSLGVLSPGASLRKDFRLLCIGSPGERLLDVSVRSQPTLLGETSIPSALSAASIPSATEILRTLTIPAVPPLLATFDTHFHHYRRPAKGLLDFSEPDGWEGASDVTLIAKLCARGPWELHILSIRVVCEDAPALRVVQSSLPATPLSLIWKPRDLFNVVYQLNIVPALTEQDKAAVINGAHLEIVWRRQGDLSVPARTTIRLPPLQPLPLDPTVSLRLPSYLTLREPTPLVYRLSNPTDRLVALSLQVDGSDTFVFAGPRKVPRLVLAPSEEREISLSVIPLVVGPSTLPRLRVFEQERLHEDGTDSADGAAPTIHELAVVAEQDVEEVKDPAQLSLETDLRAARGGDEVLEGTSAAPPFTVLVLPP